MNKNEQAKKPLGQIACESYAYENWHELKPKTQTEWNTVASAVEQAVLERLPGEWILLFPMEFTKSGDEFYAEGKWTKAPEQMQTANGVVRRRIRPTEAKAEPEWEPKFSIGDVVQGPSGKVYTVSSVMSRELYELDDPMAPGNFLNLQESLLRRSDRPLPSATSSPFLTPEELRAMLGGREPHRSDGWRREWLTDGWRPLFRSEHDENGDQQRIRGDWQTLEDCGFATGPFEHHCRTKRSLPLPPTTEQKPEGVAQRAFDSPQSESPPTGTDVPPGVWELRCHTFRNQLQSVTKERDELFESIKSQDEAFAAMKSRAEQAEKKLAEVEAFMKWTLLGAYPSNLEGKALRDAVCSKLDAETIALKDEANALRQKLQQAEASVRQWVPVSTRVPTIKDADQHGNVWALAKDEVFAEVPWNVSYMDRLLCWMTPIPSPLPTPTEEKDDAFMKWYMSIDPSPQQDAQKMMQLRTAFEAGSASNSPLTKD